MAIQNPRFGCVADFTDVTPASATSVAPQTRLVSLGSGQANPTSPLPAALTPGTGGPSSANVVLDGKIVLAASGSTTIDLNSFGGKLLTKCRGFQIFNANAPDLGSTGNITVAQTATNGFSAGGAIPASGSPATIAPGSFLAASNLNTAGWTVSSTLKTLTITAGSAGATVYIVFFGE